MLTPQKGSVESYPHDPERELKRCVLDFFIWFLCSVSWTALQSWLFYKDSAQWLQTCRKHVSLMAGTTQPGSLKHCWRRARYSAVNSLHGLRSSKSWVF